jgi:hypothetical protein
MIVGQLLPLRYSSVDHKTEITALENSVKPQNRRVIRTFHIHTGLGSFTYPSLAVFTLTLLSILM